ncbi:MAG TPA: histidine phosphatase family protein [Clostridiales bacterium]|nr:histidine phosphatase family protein [Clostridiales bacterium]
MDIVFIRHGKSMLNGSGCYIGSTDCDMGEEGYRQAEKAKELIKDASFDVVLTSPLKRAIQTAQVIGRDYMKDLRLCEMDFGIFEGLRYQDAVKKYPEYMEKWNADYLNYKIPGGESLNDVYDRVEDFINSLRGVYEKVLVITHGGVIRCALSLMLSNRDHFYRFRVDHGSISIASFDGDYSFIKAVNILSNINF